MKLEQQVCSLEIAKKLKELGVKQESLFWWFCDGSRPHRIIYGNSDVPMTNYTLLSAFTVSELGDMLPDFMCSGKERGRIDSWCAYNEDKEYIEFFAQTEADARAKMLIYLLENNLLTPHTLTR